MQPLRFGILGAARIARKNWLAIHHSGNATVTAVASRELGRAQQFIAEQQAVAPFADAPKAFDSYAALLTDPAVDAVYVPLPTGLRQAWVIRAAELGKHIVCEKPCGVNTAELREMLDACERNGVQFMDGVMFMHNPRLHALRELLRDEERIGPLRRITSVFSFLGADDFAVRNIRAQSALEPSGCLGDLGWYCLRMALWAMDWQMPAHVSGRTLLDVEGRFNGPGLPLDFSGELFFPGGVSSGFHCSFLAQHQQWATFSGPKGYLRVADFVNPTALNPMAWEVNYAPQTKAEAGVYLGTETTAEAQETLQFRNFAAQVRSGERNRDWPEIALKTQRVLDACLRSARRGGGLVEVT